MRYFQSVLILMLGISCSLSIAATTIYKCETSEGVEFSQQPCLENPQLINLKVSEPSSKPITTLGSTEQSATLESIDTYIEIKALRKQITEHQDKIDTFKVQMQKQVSTLSAKSDNQSNTLIGAQRSSAYAEQSMAAVTRFNVLIQNEQTSIDLLNQQLNRLVELSRSKTTMTVKPDKSVDAFINKQQKEREIKQSKSKIKTLTDELEAKTQRLESRFIEPAYSKKEVEFNSGLAKRMEALNNQYKVLLAIEQKQLNRLSKQ